MSNKSQELYLKGAKLFGDSLEKIDAATALEPTKHGLPVSYFLKMERANCLFLSRDASQLDEAIRLFQEVLKATPRDATVRLRLARAHDVKYDAAQDLEKKNMHLALSKKFLEEGISLAQSDPLTGPVHWINLTMRIQLGYAHWQYSEIHKIARENEEQINELGKAVVVTACAYRCWSRIDDDKLRESAAYKHLAHKAVSNVLFYAAAITNAKQRREPADIRRIRFFIDAYKSMQLEPKEFYRNFYKTRDNLMYAYEAVGDIPMSSRYALENYRELRDLAEGRADTALRQAQVEQYLGPDELVNFRSALTFLRKHQGWE